MTSKLGPLSVADRLNALYNSKDVKLVIDGEEWGVTGLNFKLKDWRLEATAFAIPPDTREDEPDEFVPSGTTIKVPIPEEGSKYVHPDMGMSVWRANRDHIVLMQNSPEAT